MRTTLRIFRTQAEYVRLSGHRQHIILYFIVVCIWIVVLSGIFYLVAKSIGRGASIDFFSYYIGASAVQQGKPVYSLATHQSIAASVGIIDADLYVYPPTLAVLMQPFLLMPPNQATLVWFGLNTVFLLIGLGLLLTQFNPQDYRLRIALLLLPVLFIPVLINLHLGQLNILMYLLIVLAYLAFIRQHPYICGILLAFSVWLKLWPLALLGYFAWKREWKVVLGGIAGLILIGLLTLVLGGIAPMTDFFSERLPDLTVSDTMRSGLEHLNHSIPGLFAKMFTASNQYFHPLIEAPNLAQWGGRITSLLLVVITVVLVSRPTQLQNQGQFDTEFMAVLVTSLLITPWLWTANLTLLLPVFFLIAKRAEHGSTMTKKHIILLIVVSVVLINMETIRLLATIRANGQAIPWFLLIFPFLGTMLMWLILVVQRFREIRA